MLSIDILPLLSRSRNFPWPGKLSAVSFSLLTSPASRWLVNPPADFPRGSISSRVEKRGWPASRDALRLPFSSPRRGHLLFVPPPPSYPPNRVNSDALSTIVKEERVLSGRRTKSPPPERPGFSITVVRLWLRAVLRKSVGPTNLIVTIPSWISAGHSLSSVARIFLLRSRGRGSRARLDQEKCASILWQTRSIPNVLKYDPMIEKEMIEKVSSDGWFSCEECKTRPCFSVNRVSELDLVQIDIHFHRCEVEAKRLRLICSSSGNKTRNDFPLNRCASYADESLKYLAQMRARARKRSELSRYRRETR